VPLRRDDRQPPERSPGATGAPAAPRSSTREDLVALMHSRHFRALFAAHFVSNLGDWVAFLALFSLAALQWHAGVLGVSFLAIAYTLPMVAVAPFAGVFVDRWDLRRVLVMSDLLRAVLVLLMGITGNLVAMCALLFVHETVSTFFNPAQVSAVPRLVPRQQLLAANALTTQAAHLTRVLGPGLAGLLVAALGPRSCFLADAVSFALSGAMLATLPRLSAAPENRRAAPALWRDLGTALRFLRAAVRLRRAVLMVSMAFVAIGAFTAIVAVYARDQLGAGSRSMGLLVSMIGMGTILGAGIAVQTAKRWGRMPTMGAGMLGLAAALAGLSQSHSISHAFVGAALLGTAAAAVLVPAQALVQEDTPRELLGRVQSSSVALISLAQLASMGAAGPLARLLGLPWLLRTLALVELGVAAILLLTALRRRLGHRHHDSAADD
jgi:DHA3 family macrolide efflux protein-like MFS transporter